MSNIFKLIQGICNCYKSKLGFSEGVAKALGMTVQEEDDFEDARL